MNPLHFIIEKLQTLDTKYILRISIGFPLVTALCIFGIHLIFVWRINTAITRIKLINTKRTAIETLLVRKAYVDGQRTKMRIIIEKDPYFRIKEYCYQVIHNLRLDGKIGKGGESVTEQSLNSDYAELLMAGSMTELTTKELVTFLIQIESNPRVYLKEVKVTNATKSSTDISYVVAALKMQ